MKTVWSKGLATWTEDNTAFISIAFTWKILEAKEKAIEYISQGYKVRAGGAGTVPNKLKKIISDVAELGGEVDALPHHNPDATMASRGCPIGCYFCIVPKMEGKEFTLLPDFIPRPILCDNNLSALPIEYQKYIIRKYKKFNVPLLDANSGFEPRSFNEEIYYLWKEINKGAWRFGYDETSEKDLVYETVKILKNEPAQKKRVYVLIGNEPIDMCLDRIMQVIAWKCEPHVQPMIALNALEKKPIIRFDWTEQKLKDMARWANRWMWRKLEFKDYRQHKADRWKEQ
jgi:hypothetical protein